MNIIFKNWKTTSAGILAIASGVAGYMHHDISFVEALAPILTGLGLLFAHDGTTPTNTPQ